MTFDSQEETRLDEREAIDRLRRGKIDALAPLVHRYQARALRAAYLITWDPMLAQDVVQAAFVRAYERIGQFDPARPFGPWFLRSVANAAVKAARREAGLTSLDAPLDSLPEAGSSLAEMMADPAPGPGELIEQRDRVAAVRVALARLSPEQRAVIVLRYYLDFSEDEMARQLATAPGTIKSRLHAARRRLAGLLRGRLSLDDWEETHEQA